MTTNKEVAIEEMLRDAEEAAEPGDTKAGTVISNSDNMTMTTSELQSAGYVYVYNTKNGGRSVVNRNMLPEILQKTHQDGSYIFSTRKPDIEIHVGEIKCILHEDSVDRKKYDSYGFIVCNKSNFFTNLDRDKHMKSRHPRAFATLQQQEEEERRDIERLERNALIETLNSMKNSDDTRGKKNG